MSKESVEKWIEKGCDYNEGCNLFAQFGKNKVIARLFPGRQLRYEGKLKYELCKAVGISDMLEQKKEVQEIELPIKQDETELPEEVKMVTAELSKLIADRSKLHASMSAMEGNNETTVNDRKDLSDEIERMSNLIDILYAVKEAY